MSASDFDANLNELEARFPWPAMPRTNMKVFYAYIHGTSELPCQGNRGSANIINVYIPKSGNGNAFTKASLRRAYVKCRFMDEVVTGTGKRCGYECSCDGSYCEAVYVKAPGKNTALCEGEFTDSVLL